MAEEARRIAKEIQTKYAEKPYSLTIGDAILYERMLVRLLPEASLRRKAAPLRDRFRRLVEPDEYQLYLESGPPDPLNGKVDDLRTDLDEILNRTNYIYSMSPFREEMRSFISTRISRWLALFLVFVTLILLLNFYQARFRILALLPVVIVGAIGGFVSVQQRIQSAPTEGDAIRGVLSLSEGWFSVYLSPLTGAISATVLYLLFAGGLLKGDLFPDIVDEKGSGPVQDFQSFLSMIEPKNSKDYAKLLIWAFIAGFAARHDPDTLNRLDSTVEAGSTAKPTALVEARTASARRARTAAPTGHQPNPTGLAAADRAVKAREWAEQAPGK